MIYFSYLINNYGYCFYLFTIIPIGIKYLYLNYFLKNDNKKIGSTKDLVLEYYFLNKNRFIKSFEDSKNYNTNIDGVFYNKNEYKNLMHIFNNQLEKEWRTRILFESTPRGNIIMFYDTYKQSFSYYCDSNSIPYYILNSVAMKYVLVFYCRDFFVDNKITEVVTDSPLISIHHVEETKKEDIGKKLMYTNKDSPFIKTKKYGATVLKNLQDVKIDFKPNFWNKVKKMFFNIKLYFLRTFFLEKKPIVVSETKTELVKEKEYNYNRFTYLGRINNFNLLQKNIKKNIANGFTTKLLDDLESEAELQKIVMDYKNYKIKKTIGAI